MKIKFYFHIGDTKTITRYIDAKDEDEALEEVMKAAEDDAFALYIRGYFIALKSDVTGYGLA